MIKINSRSHFFIKAQVKYNFVSWWPPKLCIICRASSANVKLCLALGTVDGSRVISNLQRKEIQYSNLSNKDPAMGGRQAFLIEIFARLNVS